MKRVNSKASQQYKSVAKSYDKLGSNISQAFELLLKEHDISYLSITSRTKDHDSFMEKIERKSYQFPFDQIEDICGVRIICYYQVTLKRLSKS